MTGIEYLAIGAFGMAEGLAIMLYSTVKSSNVIGRMLKYENNTNIINSQILNLFSLDNEKYLKLWSLGGKIFSISNLILIYGIAKGGLEEIIK